MALIMLTLLALALDVIGDVGCETDLMDKPPPATMLGASVLPDR